MRGRGQITHTLKLFFKHGILKNRDITGGGGNPGSGSFSKDEINQIHVSE